MGGREVKNSAVHQEGLTEGEEKLAGLLFTTKIEAKVRRREQLPDGNYRFREVVRPTSPIDFAQEGEFALKLHERQPDALLSPIYVNLRNLPENVLMDVGRVLAEIPLDEKPDFCAGIPTAGIPIAAAYSQFSSVPVEEIFEKVQTEGGRRIVAGKKAAGEKLLLIDDLVTQADTKLEAIKAAEGLGYQVVGVLVLVDREQGGSEQLAKAGYKLQAAFTLTQLLKYYLRSGKIDQARYDGVTNYLASSK